MTENRCIRNDIKLPSWDIFSTGVVGGGMVVVEEVTLVVEMGVGGQI